MKNESCVIASALVLRLSHTLIKFISYDITFHISNLYYHLQIVSFSPPPPDSDSEIIWLFPASYLLRTPFYILWKVTFLRGGLGTDNLSSCLRFLLIIFQSMN